MIQKEQCTGVVLFLYGLVQQAQSVAVRVVDVGAATKKLESDIVEALPQSECKHRLSLRVLQAEVRDDLQVCATVGDLCWNSEYWSETLKIQTPVGRVRSLL